VNAPRRRRRSRLRRALLQVGLLCGVLLALEGGLRLAGFAPPADDLDPYVGFSASLPLFVPEGDGQLVTAPNKRNHFNLQRFPAHKPPGGRRIVCLGGSSCYGHPYTDSTSFSGWLRAWLAVAEPGTPWEVINAGGISYASYRERVLLDELLAYEPDVVILYCGHNEFLEQRTYPGLSELPGWLLGLGSLLRHSAAFHAARALWTEAGPQGDAHGGAAGVAGLPPPRPKATGDGRTLLPAEVEPILDRSVGLDRYTRDDALAARVLEHMRFNLDAMARAAHAAGATVLLVAPASELADCAPFKSEPDAGLDSQQRARLDELLRLPVREAGGGWRHDEATLAALAEAGRISPRHALAAYRHGMALAAAGRWDEARVALERARDEDIVPLRALGAMRPLIADVARQTGSLYLDAVALAEQLSLEVSGQPLPGHALFLDHVHFTPEGYGQLAWAMFGELVAAGLVHPGPDWDAGRKAAVDAQVLASLQPEDHVRALGRLAAVLDWAGKSEEAEVLSDRALALSGGGDAMSHWHKGNYQLDRDELDAAIASYRAALELDPQFGEAWFNLAGALRRAGRSEEALQPARRAADLSPDSARVQFGLGAVLVDLGQDAEAAVALRAALALEPDHADALNALGLLELRAGRLASAEDLFRAATRVQPDEARGYHNLGLLLELRGDGSAARVALERALELDPTHVAARTHLARGLMASGDFGLAARLIGDGLALAPDEPRLLELSAALPAGLRPPSPPAPRAPGG